MCEQNWLFDVPEGWELHWVGMPEYSQEDQTAWGSIKVNFKNRNDREEFAKLIGQPLTDSTRSIWFPQAGIRRFADKRFTTNGPINPQYPVYVISKGRWESRLTAKALDEIGVYFRIVIEPQELPMYSAVIPEEKILVLPFSNLGQGSIPARNWVWEHAIGTGAARHWILDDNIRAFYRLYDNLKTPMKTGAGFRAVEDFVGRYENIAMAGFNYFMFANRKDAIPPFVWNTRVYSCILLQNDLPLRWRGRYNEDTDLSLRILKSGLCTALFNAFLAEKTATMTMSGGNSDELYKEDGRLKMAQSLREQHPDLVEIKWKWGRPQHSVNYRVFRRNRPVLKKGILEPVGFNNYGMELEWDAREAVECPTGNE